MQLTCSPTSQGKQSSPRQLRSKLVVKHTFLELEGRSSSPDSAPEDQLIGSRVRASSDSMIFERMESCVSCDSLEPLVPDLMPDASMGAQDLVLTGLTDDEDEGETESTSSSVTSGRNPEKLSITSGSETSSFSEPLPEVANHGQSANSCDDDDVPKSSSTDDSVLQRLASQNAQLSKENMELKQQCMEVVRAAQQQFTSSPSYWESLDQDVSSMGAASATNATEVKQAWRGQPAPVSAQAPQHPQMASAGSAGAMIPGMQIAGMPPQYVWVPWTSAAHMDSCMPVLMAPDTSAQLQGTVMFTPMASGNALLQNGAPALHNAAATRGRRGARAARAEQMFAKHAAMVATKHPTQAHKSPAQTLSTKHQAGFESEDREPPSQPCTCPEHLRTTVMLRNLPNNYSRAMLLDLIDSEGFEKQYDFIYMPMDFKTRASLGYAFVNMTTNEAANRFRLTFDGFTNWILPSRKVCGVNWSGPHQGLDAHIERYRNSPVMHEAVPDIYKPAIFLDGERAEFPAPTKKLRAPRIRHFRSGVNDFPFLVGAPEAATAPRRGRSQPPTANTPATSGRAPVERR